MADGLAELPGLCGTALHREPGAGSTARLPAPGDHLMDAGQSGPVLYEVRGEWPVAHVVRFAQEVALCGRPMPDRFVTLRSSTIPAGTDLCPGCRAVRAGWGSPDE